MLRKLVVLVALIGTISLVIPAYGQLQLDSVDITGARLANAFGATLGDHVNIGQTVQITADIKNNLNESQEFVYIIQVKDESGRVVDLAWITGLLSPGQSFNTGLSWRSDASGDYVADIFVWDSLIERNALDEFKRIEIIVS